MVERRNAQKKVPNDVEVAVHDAVRVHAVERPVVEGEQHRDHPRDADGKPEHPLRAEEQEGRADVLDQQVEKVDVEGVQALRVLGGLVVCERARATAGGSTSE